jgi:uncharacterized protein
MNDLESNFFLYQYNASILDLMTKEIVEKLSEHLFMVEMTLEGDKKLHDTIRVYKKGGGTYEDIMNAAQLVLVHNIHVTFRVNATEGDHLDYLLKDMEKRGLKDKNFAFYITHTSDYGLQQFFTDDVLCLHDEKKAIGLIPELRAVVDDNGFKKHLFTYDTQQRQKILPCNSERRGQYVIDPFGDVYLCFFTAGQKELRAGSIGDKGTIAWQPPFYEVMARNPLDFAECQQCKLLPMCGGGCHIWALKQKGTYLAPYCGNTKEIAEERIKL